MKSLANSSRKKFSLNTLSDHMVLLKAYQCWQEARQTHNEYQFCSNNFISDSTMETVMLTRNQIVSQLRQLNFITPAHMQEFNTNSHSWPTVKAALLSGLYPNLAFVENGKLQTRMEKKISIHPSSCLPKHELTNKRLWFIFEELSRVGIGCNIKGVTAVTPATVSCFEE